MNGENIGWGIGHNNPPAEVEVETQQRPTFEVKYEGQPPTEEPEAFRMRRNAELQRWLDERQNLTNIKEVEMSARKCITSTLFPTPKKGTQRYDIGGGYKVKLVHGYTYSIGIKDKTDDEGEAIPIEKQVRDAEQAVLDKHGKIGEQILKRLITWTPTLSGSAWEKLDKEDETEADVKAMLQSLVTTKDSSPQLEFEEPKADS